MHFIMMKSAQNFYGNYYSKDNIKIERLFKNMKDNITIIISCAGMGTRLGIGTTKALVDIAGKPLIIHQLEQLKNYDDIRVVVGYQAEKVIKVVKEYRDDIVFAFNNDYKTTGTAASLSKGLIGARKYVVAFDGDLLVNPDDLEEFLELEEECIGGCTPTTDNPVLMTIDHNENVVEFSRDYGTLEWTGLAKLRTDRLISSDKHVYMMIEPLLPIKVKKIRTKEIDTQNDYENAVRWVKNGYMD